jgi:hypothetical protein
MYAHHIAHHGVNLDCYEAAYLLCSHVVNRACFTLPTHLSFWHTVSELLCATSSVREGDLVNINRQNAKCSRCWGRFPSQAKPPSAERVA